MPEIFAHFVPAIMQTKRDYWLQPLDEETENHAEKSYVPYVINKALSFHMDCIMAANEMNKLPFLDKKMQNQFYLNIIRGYKRPFQKWVKYVKPEDLELVKEYYNFSNEKATEALSILTPDQLNNIKKQMDTGGVEKNDRTRKPSLGKTKRKKR